MKRVCNDHTLEQVRQNGSFLSELVCCGHPVPVQFSEKGRVCRTCGYAVSVSLVRERDPIRQSCQWSIFIGGAQGTFIGFLSCAYCERSVSSLDRLCACGYFCSVCVLPSDAYRVEKSPVWEIHSCVLPSVDDVDESMDGIHICLDEPGLPTDTPLLLDVSNIDTHVGELYCPAEHVSANMSITGLYKIHE